MFLSSGDICSKTIRLNKIKDTITFNNSCKTLLLQAECNLLRICDSAWELLLGRDVCSTTREQKKAINIPQGDHDNSKTSRNSHIWFDGQEGWGSTLRFARCWVFQMKMSLHGRTRGGSWCYQRIHRPFITAELAALGGVGLLSLLQMVFLFYATAFLQ